MPLPLDSQAGLAVEVFGLHAAGSLNVTGPYRVTRAESTDNASTHPFLAEDGAEAHHEPRVVMRS